MYAGFHVKYLLFLSYFNESRIFPIDVPVTLKHQILRKSVQWEPKCEQTEGQIDMTKLNVVFHSFGNAPKSHLPLESDQIHTQSIIQCADAAVKISAAGRVDFIALMTY